MRPLCEDNLPELSSKLLFRVKSDVPVKSCSPAASRVNGSLTINGIEMVSAEPLRSSKPISTAETESPLLQVIPFTKELLQMLPRVASVSRIRRVSLSVTVPAKFKSPPNLSRPPERSNSGDGLM